MEFTTRCRHCGNETDWRSVSIFRGSDCIVSESRNNPIILNKLINMMLLVFIFIAVHLIGQTMVLVRLYSGLGVLPAVQIQANEW